MTRKQQYIVDVADTFQTYIYENNAKIVPTSATLTVYKPGSDTALISAQSMTVASDGLLSYSLTTTHNDTADDNYKAEIAYVYNSTTYYTVLYYDVVNTKLFKVITDDDIIIELPQLREKSWRVHGTADSGSTTTIVDTELKRFDDDYFTGGLAYSITQDSTKKITDFVQSTGTVTTEAFDSAVSTDKYVLMRSFSKEIQRAFEKIEDLLYRKGKRPHLILDPYDLRECHIYFAVAEVCKGLVADTGEGNMWWEFMEKYKKEGFAIFNNLNLKYDDSEDGYITGSEESRRINVIRSGRR